MKIHFLSLLLGTSLFLHTALPVMASATNSETATISSNVAYKSASLTATPFSDSKYSEKSILDLQQLLENKTVSALVYLCDEYEIKSAADADSTTVVTVPSGQQVFIRDYTPIADTIWYKVSCFVDGMEYEGYIDRQYLAYSDEDFLTWEETYLRSYLASFPSPSYASDGTYADVAQFPASYQSALNNLKATHPNWIFVRFNTNLDWNTVIANEDVIVNGEPRNAISASASDAWKSGTWTSNWSRASTAAIKYYMDPRNFLNETYIFQFEQLTYNASYHTTNAVQNILNNSFMAGAIPEDSRTYAQAFFEIGSSLGVSPFHLACRVYQEQGANGNSSLISGTYPGYENLYNYYNIGATGSSDTAIITNGLTRARNEGWTTRLASLSGGAQILSKNYILKGQDTLYLQKFDVDSSYNSLYYHQYMQNIKAPCSEGNSIRKAYTNSGAINNNFVFKIPVYNNMPATACPEPGTSASPYTDVSTDAWYYNSVINATNNGWMVGVSSSEFAPHNSLSRSMFAAVLYRLNGSPAVSYKAYFSDIPEGQWYTSAVIWAYEKGIVSGYTDGTFLPNNNITREQMAKMLKNYASYQNFDTAARAELSNFVDSSSISSWATTDIQWAASHGFIAGKPQNGKLYVDPQGNATRAECASILERFFNTFRK